MGNLNEISAFKGHEIGRELGREGGNNWAVVVTKNGKRVFDSVHQKRSAAEMRVIKLEKKPGLNPKVSQTSFKPFSPMKEGVEYFTLNQIKKQWAKDYPGTKFKFEISKYKGAERLAVLSPKGHEIEVYDKVPGAGWTIQEMKKENKMLSFKDFIKEGVDDPAIFKAVFLAGGPGSGKSFTVGKTGLSALGFRVVNSDDVFEFALKKAGLTTEPEHIWSPKGQEIRKGAKSLTAKKMGLYLNGRLGLVIDGTGKDYDKIARQAKNLQELGYETAMIFVNTDLETAVHRDSKRSRTLGREMVKKMWQDVQNNLGKFQNLFKNNFIIVDNSEGTNIEKGTISAYKKIQRWSKTRPQNRIAKDWIRKAGGKV